MRAGLCHLSVGVGPGLRVWVTSAHAGGQTLGTVPGPEINAAVFHGENPRLCGGGPVGPARSSDGECACQPPVPIG